MSLRPIAVAIASAVFLFAALPAVANPDAPPKPECSENCADAGYEWAEKNAIADDAHCSASSEEFSAGCQLYVEEQRQAAAPPLEEPVSEAKPVLETDPEPEAKANDVAPVDPPSN